MITLKEFYEKYPAKIMKQGDKQFTYRYYKNPKGKATLVLLTGGIGLSDLFYLHFERFAKEFSVLTFDYQMDYADNREFADGVAKLLSFLGIRAWLVGQSLGGIVAQIIAKQYPEVVEGLVLSNTCSLAKDMGQEAYGHLMNMIENQQKSKKLLKVIPFSLYKKLIKNVVMKKKTTDFTEEEKNLMEGLCDVMLALLTKPYELHMIDFLIDAQNHFGMVPEDFTRWDGKVLLLLSEDDDTFSQPVKDSLAAIMPHPTVITDITGGHLALLIRLDKYAQIVTGFIEEREGQEKGVKENA